MDKKISRIGVFDSGIGGLTVLKCLLELVPGVDMVYLGDSARLPYGTKSSRTIIRYSLQCARFLASMDIDMLVIACNTASAHAIPALKDEFHIPVIGVVEAGARAAIECGGSRIGVIGTSSTIKSHAYEETMKSLKQGLKIFPQACPLFVPLVEEGWYDDEITEQVARRYLKDIIHSRGGHTAAGMHPLSPAEKCSVKGYGKRCNHRGFRALHGTGGQGDCRIVRMIVQGAVTSSITFQIHHRGSLNLVSTFSDVK